MSKKAELRGARRESKQEAMRVASLAGLPEREPKASDRVDFDSEQEAFDWMQLELLAGEEFMDSFRLGYLDDPASMAAYEKIRFGGCCGSHDGEIRVGGREAMVGCNFGH